MDNLEKILYQDECWLLLERVESRERYSSQRKKRNHERLTLQIASGFV